MAFNDYYVCRTPEGIFAGMVAPSTQTQLEQFISAMPPNSWAEYPDTNINEMQTTRFDGVPMAILESSGNYPLTNWANKFVWDAATRSISGVGTAQGFTIAGGERYAKQVTFNAVSNRFSTKWNPTGQKQGHIYDGNCSCFVGDLTYRKAYNEPVMWAYNKATDLWSSSYTLVGLPSVSTVWSIDCNAAHNALYCLEQVTGRLVKFDLATGVRSVVGTYANIGNYPIIVSIGSYILFGAGGASAKLYKMDVSGSVTLVAEALPVPYDAAGNYRLLPHPSDNLKAICISKSDLKVRSLDIMTGTFSDVSNLPSEPEMSASVSASLIGLGAVATWRGTGRTADVTQSKFWIYKV